MKKSHGMTHSRTYTSWVGMKARCLNQKNPKYNRYGGRGIKVCPQWVISFDAFLADMGEVPQSFSLDRIDSNGNYEPSNCRWADQKTQQNNRTNNHRVLYAGQWLTLAQLQDETGLSQDMVQQRLARGVPMEEAIR